MNFKESYNRNDFIDFLKNLIPDLAKDIRPVGLGNSYKSIKHAEFIGTSDKLDLSIFELKIEGKAEKKIYQAKEGFKLMKDHQTYRALAVYYSKNDKNWRLSLMQMTPEKTETGNITQKFSNPRRYSFYLGPQAKTRTPENFLIKKGEVKDFEDLLSRFSVEVVNKEFYKEIAKYFRMLVGGDVKISSKTEHFEREMTLPSVDKSDHKTYQEFAVRLIGRIIFCWFLKQKKSKEGISLLPDKFLSRDSVEKNEGYYHAVLEKIFFEVLNKPINQRNSELTDGYHLIPYLNGGLFDPHHDDYYENQPNYALKIPDSWFLNLFEILETYNFTIDENTVLDVDLSIDPEMLGRIFENLLAEINPETGESARKSTGSYYTPRSIVEYMVDQSIVQYLITRTSIDEEKIKVLITVDGSDDLEFPLTSKDKQKIVDALDEVKIIDPACGSGAFPIGMLQKIVWILGKIDENGKLWFEKKIENLDPMLKADFKQKFANENFDYIRKTGIIRDSIYGVDIQSIAVEVSKLRCFLTLIVDEDIIDEAVNRGIKPLPNLEFKFVAANTLIDIPNSNNKENDSISMFESKDEIENLKKLRDDYFVADDRVFKEKIKADFLQTQTKIALSQINKLGMGKKSVALATWEPFKDTSCKWFDPEWMFGIEKFDIVIGNPPYISVKKISLADKKTFSHIFETGKGRFNLFTLFLEKGHKLINKSGFLTYILPEGLFSNPEYRHIRYYLVQNSTIISVCLFSKKVFEAAVDTAVILFKNSKENKQIKIYRDTEETDVKLSQKELDIKPNYLFPVMVGGNNKSIITKLNNTEKFIDCLEVQQGIIYSGRIKSDVFSNAKLTDQYKKVLDGRDILRYRINWNEKAENRYIKYSKDLHRPRKERIFLAGEKIVLPRRSTKLICTIDDSQYYLLNTAYIILPKIPNINLYYILALLNSRLIDFYYQNLFFGWQITIPALNSLPILIGTEYQQNKLIKIVKKILSLKNNDKNADTKNLESQIDQLVYKLYVLTPEEIKIVEESIK